MAISDGLLRQTVTIERFTEGTRDDYGVPAQTYASHLTLRSSVQPLTTQEMAQLSQGGPVSSTWKAYVKGTPDIVEGDRLTSGGHTYGIDQVLNEAGWDDHLKLILHRVEVPA